MSKVIIGLQHQRRVLQRIFCQRLLQQAIIISVVLPILTPSNWHLSSHFDASRVGSHKDIWPTLYQLSLSEAPYYRTDCGLLSEKSAPLWCQGYDPNLIITQHQFIG
ncbi:TPA: hypothetical protein ACY2HE_001582 [Yersinia enterocolitica]|uniref:hypothetical protein n=1 Tax=Yersinia enterocolitica TaxID=630 RepID=UPI000ADA735D